MESILTSIKKMLEITEENEHFDHVLTMHINSVFSTLTQSGVGPSEGFFIDDSSSTWDEFIGDAATLNSVKSYVFLKVKLMFDTSTTPGGVISAIERQISELEWRLNVTSGSLPNAPDE